MELIERLAAAGIVILLAWAAMYALRRRPVAGRNPARGVAWLRSSSGQKALQSEARLALTPQHALHVVRVGTHRFLLSTHPAGLSTIAELSEADLVEAAQISAREAGTA